MYATYTVFLRELKRTIRARSRFIGGMATPFFWMAIVGIGMKSAVSFKHLDINFFDFVIPGIIGMTILFTSMFSGGIQVIFDREFGFLKEMLVAPISRTSIVVGKILGGTIIAMMQATIILFLAIPFGVNYESIFGVFAAFIFMILISISFVSFGLIFASQLRDFHGFQIVSNFFIMPLFFLSGAIFPIQSAPKWMQVVSYFNPLSYGVDGLRGALIGVSKNPIWMDFSILITFSLILMTLAFLFFENATE